MVPLLLRIPRKISIITEVYQKNQSFIADWLFLINHGKMFFAKLYEGK